MRPGRAAEKVAKAGAREPEKLSEPHCHTRVVGCNGGLHGLEDNDGSETWCFPHAVRQSGQINRAHSGLVWSLATPSQPSCYWRPSFLTHGSPRSPACEVSDHQRTGAERPLSTRCGHSAAAGATAL